MDHPFNAPAKAPAAGRSETRLWLGSRFPGPARDAGAEFDALTIALAQGMSRREVLRRLGGVLTSTLLASLGLGRAWGQNQPFRCKTNGDCPNPSIQTCCKGDCVDTRTDPNHCGACGNACTGGRECINESCQCPPTKAACDGQCVDTATDPNHCGGCGKRCRGNHACCSGRCTAILEDVKNCGACGNVCPKDQQCLQGKCVPIKEEGPSIPCGASSCHASRPVCCLGAPAVCYSGGTTCCIDYACPPGYTCSGAPDLCCPEDRPFFDIFTGLCSQCAVKSDCSPNLQCCETEFGNFCCKDCSNCLEETAARGVKASRVIAITSI